MATKQYCEHFTQDWSNGIPVEEQIQEYMDDHPNRKVAACSYAITGVSKEALLVFYESNPPAIVNKGKEK